MEYTQISGPERAAIRFISTGEKAFVETDDGVFELPEKQVADLREGGGEEGERISGSCGSKIGWSTRKPPDRDEVGGDETDKLRAKLDVVAAINDLISAAQDLGVGSAAGLEQLEGAKADQVERSVESATIEILSEKDDRLLRRILLVADFGVDVPEDVRKGLGSFAGAHVTFDLTIAKPNEPVDVQEPADADPYPG